MCLQRCWQMMLGDSQTRYVYRLRFWKLKTMWKPRTAEIMPKNLTLQMTGRQTTIPATYIGGKNTMSGTRFPLYSQNERSAGTWLWGLPGYHPNVRHDSQVIGSPTSSLHPVFRCKKKLQWKGPMCDTTCRYLFDNITRGLNGKGRCDGWNFPSVVTVRLVALNRALSSSQRPYDSIYDNSSGRSSKIYMNPWKGMSNLLIRLKVSWAIVVF